MEQHLVSQYAVVAYVHGPLGQFVNGLRSELTPGCPHRAHVTVLPPRLLQISEHQALNACYELLDGVPPFPLTLSKVSLFPETHVIKLELSNSDAKRLRELHDDLNRGPLHQAERFPYTPHITLCMNGVSGETNELFGRARQRWAEFGGSATIWVDALTLVRQREDETWADLAEIELNRQMALR